MNTEQENVVITGQRFLGAVAVMNIEVDNENLVNVVPVLEIPGGDCNIVEQAKSHRHRVA